MQQGFWRNSEDVEQFPPNGKVSRPEAVLTQGNPARENASRHASAEQFPKQKNNLKRCYHVLQCVTLTCLNETESQNHSRESSAKDFVKNCLHESPAERSTTKYTIIHESTAKVNWITRMPLKWKRTLRQCREKDGEREERIEQKNTKDATSVFHDISWYFQVLLCHGYQARPSCSGWILGRRWEKS
jgi:hypothetical protein